MKQFKMFGLAAVAAMALVALLGVGTASATVLCKTNVTSGCGGWHYSETHTIHITQDTGTTTTFSTSGGTVLDTCTGETTHKVTTTTGSSTTTVSGPIQNLSWGTCTRTTHTLKIGSLEVHHIAGTDNGTLTMTGGTEWTIDTIFGSCVYGSGAALDVGKIYGGNPATIKTDGAVIPKISGNFACPSTGISSGQFTVTSPTPLYVSAS